MGIVGKELVAIDGSIFRACNSKKNNYSDKKIDRNIKYIDEKIDKYIQELDETDIAEVHDRKPSTEEINKRLKELRERKQNMRDIKVSLKQLGQLRYLPLIPMLGSCATIIIT